MRKSWNPWFAEMAERKRHIMPRSRSVYMTEDGPISVREAIDRYGPQCLQGHFVQTANA